MARHKLTSDDNARGGRNSTGNQSQRAEAKARLDDATEKFSKPENVIGTDAYARKNGLPPYDKD